MPQSKQPALDLRLDVDPSQYGRALADQRFRIWLARRIETEGKIAARSYGDSEGFNASTASSGRRSTVLSAASNQCQS